MPADPPDALARTDAADEDIEQQRVRARVRQGLFGGTTEPVRLDQFELSGRLGEGAMGVVYEARDSELDRVVALKLLSPGLRDSGAPTELLLEEARAMARVRHPNVVTVHQVGTHGGQVYVAMERAKGTLRQWLERDRPPARRVLEVLLATGRGLAAVHRQGLVHRDFKLDNVLMDDDGQPRVSDFGLALRNDRSVQSSGGQGALPRGALVGTPAYMAPEQLRGEAVDARSDQWSYCVTAVEAFTGQRPFHGDTPDELLESMLERVTAADLDGVPPAVARVLRRGLDPEPSGRFPSMDALLERLETARSAAPAPRRSWSTGWLAAAGVALMVAIAIVAATNLRHLRPSGTASSASAAAPRASAAAPPMKDITRLCRTGVRASSQKPGHPAADAFDGVPETAWVEAAPGDGAGQWVEADFRPGTFVSEVEVGGGWSATTASGTDLWKLNTTFRRMRVSWDGGEKVVTFNRKTDRGKRKRVVVNARTQHIRITALEVDRGPFLDLCLDEVVIFGRCPPPVAPTHRPPP